MKLQSILTTHFFIKNLKRQLFFEIVNDSQVLNHLNSRINTVDILYGCVLTYCVLYTLQDYHINTTKKSQYTFDWIFIILSIVFTKDVRNAI